ncbi:MAG: type 1 glutamine amidotransferase [Candidatus Omnitrophica bacterium]|nr:type 1 glutamine amidotransferase [Candidatus Omnitrophota bacterium]
MIYFLQHIDIEGPGLLLDFFQSGKLPVQTIRLYAGDSLPDPADADAVVILGGSMNVYEEKKFPFLAKENSFIQDILTQKIPVLGICLGAQLIAKASGAIVTRASSEEIGWHTIDFTPEGLTDPLFEGIGENMEVFQWHHDTFTIPPGSQLLATSAICDQAFRIGNAYALQFHVEIKPKMIVEWIKEYVHRDRWNNSYCTQMVLRAHDIEDTYNLAAQRIFLNFARLINKNIPVQ